jgi:Kef-type K+ transport system membrane component KefB
MGEDLLFIVLLAAGAAAVPFASSRLNIPSSIAEIAYGMLLIKILSGHRPEWFGFFKELGLIYLMFIAGMELNLRKLVRQGRFYLYLILIPLPFIVMPLAFRSLGLPFFLGVVVSVVSAGVLIPVLKEMSLMNTPMGREIVNMTLTGEFVSIAVLAGLDIYHHHGLGPAAAWSLIKIALLFTGAVVFLKILYLVAWWHPARVERVMESDDPVEEGVRATIFIVLLGALLAFHAGVEPILGSFMAGVVFSDVFKRKGRFEEKLNAVGFGFFIPLFFIGVGADFDLSLFTSFRDVGFALLLSLGVFISNLPVFSLPLFVRMSFREAWGAGLLLSSPLSMMIVAATLGLKAGMLEPEHFGPIVLASMISSVLYPSVFRLAGDGLAPEHEPGHDAGLSAP